MKLNETPPEVLSLILGQLVDLQGPVGGDLTLNFKPLAESRLVCRKWNTLASQHLYHSISLVHHDTPDEDQNEFQPWNHMTETKTIRGAAHRAVIKSAPEDMSHDADYDVWQRWKIQGEYPRFTEAIDRLKDLPNLKAIHLRFTKKCRGKESAVGYDDGWEDSVEPRATRLNTLKAVFSAMIKRAESWDNARVRSLTLEHVQNSSLESLVAPEMSAVIKDITNLHIMAITEYNEHGPDRDIYFAERREFEPHLQKEILPHFRDSLTTLTLGFDEYWGTAPGYFDGKGLIFPNLTSLTLLSFVISHHDHFEWVALQTSLRTLRLGNCHIVSHLHVDESDTTLEVPKHDWERFTQGAFENNSSDSGVYTFSGTWEAEFDRIRTSLTKLVDFRFGYSNGDGDFLRPDGIETRLFPNRYITFDEGICPTPWGEANEEDGEMEFEYCYPDSPDEQDADFEINRAKETEEGDARAFEALLQAVRDRR